MKQAQTIINDQQLKDAEKQLKQLIKEIREAEKQDIATLSEVAKIQFDNTKRAKQEQILQLQRDIASYKTT